MHYIQLMQLLEMALIIVGLASSIAYYHTAGYVREAQIFAKFANKSPTRKLFVGGEKFLYFRVSKIWSKHSLDTVSSENRLPASQT